MRIRTIKPEFWMHEGLASKPEFTRLLAIALLNWADDDGYFMANPILIRGQLFPFQEDSKIIPRSLHELSRVGWIELSESPDGRAIGRIVNFRKHQRVDKPQLSKIKDLWTFPDDSKNGPRIFQDDSKGEWKGMEGKGREHPCPQADVLAEIWNLSPPLGKSRSSKKQVADVWRKIPAKDRPDNNTLLSSFRQWLKSDDWTKEGGSFVPGLHLWIKNQKWEVEPTTSAQPKKKASLPDGFGV